MVPNKETEILNLISSMIPKIKQYASKYYPFVERVLSFEDLVNAGITGLLEALNNFDQTKGVPFQAFADFRIKGAILDEIRAIDGVSKEFREKINKVMKVLKNSEINYNELTDDEIAKQAGISKEELQEVYLTIKAMDVVSLDVPIKLPDGGDVSLYDVIKSPEFESPELIDLKWKLGKLIDKLPEKEKMVITLFYYEDLNFREIASILNLTPGRVSQLHGKALLKLKAMLNFSETV